MKGFKDFVAHDVSRVFINLNEFGEEHDINGCLIPCIIDTNVTIEGEASLEGVFLNDVTIHLPEFAIEVVPVEGEVLSLDGSLHIVRRVSRESGVLVIVAEANEQ